MDLYLCDQETKIYLLRDCIYSIHISQELMRNQQNQNFYDRTLYAWLMKNIKANSPRRKGNNGAHYLCNHIEDKLLPSHNNLYI